MSSLEGIVENGQIIINTPTDWPDGTRVSIEPLQACGGKDEPFRSDRGMIEEEQGDNPESIARWIAAFDAIPPLQMTPEEETEWHAARKAQKSQPTLPESTVASSQH